MGMFSGISSALGAVLNPSALLNVGSSALALGGDIWANEQNRKLAHDQMNTQILMSNTAHQREVDDLRRAGLNPILSAKYGGASTPPGSSAQMINPVNSASRLLNENRLIAEQIDNIEADTAKKESEKNLLDTERDKMSGVDTDKTRQDIAESLTRAGVNTKQLDSMQAQIESLAARVNLDTASAYNLNLDSVVKEIEAQFYHDNPWVKKLDTFGKNAIFDRIKQAADLMLRGRMPKSAPKQSTKSPRNWKSERGTWGDRPPIFLPE